jgi:hypothetical protein
MSFQVKHHSFGVFQGKFFGFLKWSSASPKSGQGFFQFGTKEEAKGFIDQYCSSPPMSNPGDFKIEKFNEVASRELASRSAR